MDTHYDVVIVGAGITGAILAWQAAEAGRSVLVLEAGTDTSRTYAGYHSQVETFFGAAAKTPEAPWRYNANAPSPDIPGVGTPGADYFVERGPVPFASTYARLAGGTTLHWLGTCLRMIPEDFDCATRFGRGLDWPIGYADLAPDYERAEWEIGVAGNVRDQAHLGITFRDGYQYPMERIPPSYSDGLLSEKVDGMLVEVGGQTARLLVRSTPAGRNSTPRPGYRPVGAVDLAEGFGPADTGQDLVRDLGERCQGNSACVPICPVQAKYNALKTLAKAVATGRVTVLTQAVAARVVTEGRRVTGIEYLRYAAPDRPEHGSFTARGTTYVLACHAVENAKLLLMSGLQSPNGLVGANLTDHPTVLAWGLAPEQAGAYRGPLSTSGIEDLRGGAFRSELGAFRIEVGNDGWLWPMGAPDTTVTDAVGKGLFGRALRDTLRDRIGRQVRMGCLVEQPSSTRNRVTLDPSQVDALGLPRPVITYDLEPYVLKGMAAAAATMRTVFAQAGIEDRTDPKDSFLSIATWEHQALPWGGAGHLSGTHCMGTGPESSVVDAQQRSWQHDNLFVAGPGSMPSMGTANPTLTVAALAFRTARDLIASPEERGATV